MGVVICMGNIREGRQYLLSKMVVKDGQAFGQDVLSINLA